MSDRPDRDPVLERLMASLEAPPATERFRERLWERIEAAERLDAAQAGVALGVLEAPPARERFRERLWERIEAAEAIDGAAAETVARRAPRRWAFRRPRLAAAAVAAAAVAAVVAVTLIGWPLGREQGGLGGPPPAVAQVIENVRLRLGSSEAIGAVFTYERSGTPPLRARVLATSDGRVRTSSLANADGSWSLPPAGAKLTDTPGLHVVVTNMPDGTRTEAWNADGQVTVRRTTDLAPGAPDGAGSGLFPAEYAGQMSALAVEGASVVSTTYEGRPALLVSAPARPPATLESGRSSSPARYDAVAMTIDRGTWLPVRVERTYRGALVEAWSFSDVQLDPPLTAGDFTVRLPDDAKVVTGDGEGFRRVSLPDAGTVVQRCLFVPAALPDGFALSLTAVRGLEGAGQYPTRTAGSAVISLVYRQGFRSIVVTTRAFDDAKRATDDPFAGAAPAEGSAAAEVVLRSGWLTGEKAHVSASPLGLPHLWVAQDGLLVTVAGDVTRRELLQVAGSLEPYGVWATGQVFTAYTTATQAYDLNTLGDLYSRGVEIDSRRYAPEETEEALIKNSEMTDYFVSGEVVSTFSGDGAAFWEAWPGEYVTFGGSYSPEAVAEVVTMRDDKVVRQEFFWVTGPSVKAGQKSPHPEQLRSRLSAADTAAAARRTARAYAAALKRRDAAALARMCAPGVAFLDVGYGDHGRRPALRRRYERMFAFPADLAFRDLRTSSGPGWAVIRWTAASAALGYDGAAGLTVLEMRDGKIARGTLYCSRDDMPFR
jgi:ketosteroid isomerase-like protein